MTNWKDYLNSLKLSTAITISVIILLVTFNNSSFGQTSEPDSDARTDTTQFIMHKSPMGAVLRSALIPGWGQIYNESYWKAPIIWGALGVLGYFWVDNNDQYKHFRDLYVQSIDENNPNGNLRYYDQREFYRDQRDLTAVFIGLSYLINILDAYVDAHLYDFDVSAGTNNMTLSLRISF